MYFINHNYIVSIYCFFYCRSKRKRDQVGTATTPPNIVGTIYGNNHVAISTTSPSPANRTLVPKNIYLHYLLTLFTILYSAFIATRSLGIPYSRHILSS